MAELTVKGFIVSNLKPTTKYFALILIGLLLLTVSASIFAETDDVSHKPLLRLNNFSTKAGLSHPNVFEVIQDDNGYLWIATEDGLNRFDGKNFVQFFADKTNEFAVPDSMITSMHMDKSGRIWLGSNRGLSYIHSSGNKFINLKLDFSGEPELKILDIIAAEKNNLWLLGLKTLWHFDSTNKILTNISETVDFNPGSGVSIKNIQRFVVDKVANLYLGTRQGIFIKTMNSKNFSEINAFPGKGDEIQKMKIFNNTLWVATPTQLYHYDFEKKQWKIENFASTEPPLYIQDIHISKNVIWLAAGNGLWMKYPDCACWYNYQSDPLDERSLPNDIVAHIFEDKQSQLWFSTVGEGLSVRNPKNQLVKHWLDTRQTSSFSKWESIFSVSVNDIKLGMDGNFYVATDKGLYRLSSKGIIEAHFATTNTPQLSSNYINQIHLDLSGNLWITPFPFGLLLKTNSGEWIDFEQSVNEYVFEIYEDRQGQIWVGTLAGVYLIEISKAGDYIPRLINYPEQVMKSGSRTNVVYQGVNGYYWFGTEAGLLVFDESLNLIKIFNTKDDDNRILSNSINDITEDLAGNVWIATGSGLNRISHINNNWKVFDYPEHKLLNGKVLFLVEHDKHGNIWTAGSKGLLKFNSGTEQLSQFSQNVGMQGLEFGVDANYKGDDGMLFFGGSNGLNVLPSDFNLAENTSSSIFLSEVKINSVNNSLKISKATDGSYFIPKETRFSRFYFDVVDLDSTSSYVLRIRIPELSEEWLPWTERRHFDFFDLPSGDITLEVQSKNLNTTKIINQIKIKLKVESSYSAYDYFFWLMLLIISISTLLYLRRLFRSWEQEKLSLFNSQLRLSETISLYKTELANKNQENEQLLDELASTIKDKFLLENQISDLHLVDKQTGLHTREFISLSIDTAARQYLEYSSESGVAKNADKTSELLMLLIKLDGFESLRLEGGQFLINQMVIQIAAEIETVSENADELVKWSNDSFLLFSRAESIQATEEKIKKIINAINAGVFGPSETEKLPVTCSIAAIQFPFAKAYPSKFNWELLIEFAEAAASFLSQQGGNQYLLLSENTEVDFANVKLIQMQSVIDDFESASKKHWLMVTTSDG